MTADPLAWFDPPICCGCYTDHPVSHHDQPAGTDAFGMVRHCPECGVHTSGPHTVACSRSGVMLGERHHRQAEEETG